jgi:hypothetical protein
MALPTNNSRPAIPYVPTQVLPNYDRYESLGQFPPTAQQLDGDLNKMIDLINTLSDEINHVVVGALPGADDPLNANSLMTTDGAGNISWVKAASANLDEGAVTTPKIANAAITSEKIQPQAITNEKLADGISVSKLTGTGNYVVTTTGPGYQGSGIGLTSALNKVMCSQANAPYGVFRYLILNDLPTITGAKLQNQTITNAQIANQTITAAQIANQTITAAQIANQTITAAQIANQTITGNQIANQTITGTKIANQTITAAQIANQTITATQLQNAGQMVPFAMGYYKQGAGVQKGVNANVNKQSTGLYSIQFLSAAKDTNYIVLLTTENPSSATLFYAEVAYGTRSTQGFTVRTGFNSTLYDLSFNFLVYSF